MQVLSPQRNQAVRFDIASIILTSSLCRIWRVRLTNIVRDKKGLLLLKIQKWSFSLEIVPEWYIIAVTCSIHNFSCDDYIPINVLLVGIRTFRCSNPHPIPPPLPVFIVVGQNIDRCITLNRVDFNTATYYFTWLLILHDKNPLYGTTYKLILFQIPISRSKIKFYFIYSLSNFMGPHSGQYVRCLYNACV